MVGQGLSPCLGVMSVSVLVHSRNFIFLHLQHLGIFLAPTYPLQLHSLQSHLLANYLKCHFHVSQQQSEKSRTLSLVQFDTMLVNFVNVTQTYKYLQRGSLGHCLNDRNGRAQPTVGSLLSSGQMMALDCTRKQVKSVSSIPPWLSASLPPSRFLLSFDEP